MPNDQQGMKLPIPSKDDCRPDAHDPRPGGGPLKYVNPESFTIHRFTSSEKSPAKADHVVKGLQS